MNLTGWKNGLVFALLLAVWALGACQSPRSTAPKQAASPPISTEGLPTYPWPTAQERRPTTGVLPDYATRPQPEAVYAPQQRVLPPGKVRVGVLLPLSGANRNLGQALFNAAQLAMFDFADGNFELVPFDTQGTALGAETAAQTAVGEGVAMILGPLLAPSVRAAAPYAHAANVPIIAFSSDRTVAGNGVYTMGFLPSEQVRRVVGHALSKGMVRFAALAPSNPYGETVVQALREAVDLGGGVIERVRFYDPTATDFSAVVRELGDFDERKKALEQERAKLEGKQDEISKRALERLEHLQTLGDPPFEALLVADGGKRLQAVAAMLPFFDIDPQVVKMLGTGLWDEPGTGTEPALMGGWYAAPPPGARTAFEAQYAEVFGEAPPRLATLAYDATALAAVLARAEGGTGFGDAAIQDPAGFAGRDGIFRFSPEGTVERRLAVLEVLRDRSRVISPAPDTFSPALY